MYFYSLNINKIAILASATHNANSRPNSKESKKSEASTSRCSQHKTAIDGFTASISHSKSPARGNKPIGLENSSPRKQTSIRTYNGIYSLNCISTKQPKDIFNEFIKSLNKEKIKSEKMALSPFMLDCRNKQGVRFEIEIMLLEDIPGFCYARMKKLQGDLNLYREIANKLLNIIKL